MLFCLPRAKEQVILGDLKLKEPTKGNLLKLITLP
jgi:hypothetical protein